MINTTLFIESPYIYKKEVETFLLETIQIIYLI